MLVDVVFAAAQAPVNPVSFDVWTLIFQSLNVLIVMGVLYFMLFKPVAGVMKKRETFVEDSLSQAASAKEEAERLLAEYREQMQKARAEAQAIIDKASQDAEEYSRSKRAEADADAQAMLAQAKADIEHEREKALESIRDEVATLAVLAAGKVIGRSLDKEAHEDLVKDFVSKVKAGELN